MRSLERKKRLKIAITSMFSRRRRRSRARKEWICESRCQISDRLHFFAEYFDLNPYPSATTVYARSAFYPSLRFTLSLHSTHSLHFTPGLQSAVCILHTVCILPLVRSLQSEVRSPQSSFYTDRKQYWPPRWRAYSCPPTWQPKLLFVCILLNV